MTYDEALEFVHNKSRLGTKLGLDRVIELNSLMGNPQQQLKFVHIAGTNGKGSTSMMLTNVLMEANYRVGVFTSPVIYRFHEYFRVNNTEITDAELVSIVKHMKSCIDLMEESPTEFEMITMIAIEYFKRKKCDIVVFEVGMGGRLDCTNLIENTEAAVITSIGLDHMEYLGNTVAEIAWEKAGIIKNNCKVILYDQDEVIVSVVNEVCEKKQAKLTVTDNSKIYLKSFGLEEQVFCYTDIRNLSIKLMGEHQLKNAAVVIETVRALDENGWQISEQHLRDGLSKTRWPARFELLQKEPAVLIDGGHNPQCFESLAAGLNLYFGDKKIIFVMGVLADKDYESMLRIIIPYAKKFFTITPENPRALKSVELGKSIRKFHVPVTCSENPLDGLKGALGEVGKEDVICVTGTFSVVSEIRLFYGLG